MFNLHPVPVPDLSGKKILVTGAGRGIGAVVTGQLVANGASVLAGVLGEAHPDWASHLEGADVFKLDVRDQDSVDGAIARATDGLDILINNAGSIQPIGHLDKINSDAFGETFNVNVVGVHRMIKAALARVSSSMQVREPRRHQWKAGPLIAAQRRGCGC